MSVSFSPNGNRLLVAGILPSFYVYTIEASSAIQEIDTISVNEREKQFGGSLSIPLNSGLLIMSERKSGPGSQAAADPLRTRSGAWTGVSS